MKRLLFLLRCAGSLLESRTSLSNHSPASRLRNRTSFNEAVKHSEVGDVLFCMRFLGKLAARKFIASAAFTPKLQPIDSEWRRATARITARASGSSTWPLNHPLVNLFATTGTKQRASSNSVQTGIFFALQALKMRLDMRSVDVDYWINQSHRSIQVRCANR
jgi:hypothetical protein